MKVKEYIENYVKEKDIKGYIKYKELEKLDRDFYNGCNDFSPVETYNYLYAMENEEIKELLTLIYECEFDIEINTDGTLSLIDLQGENLGDIESETFGTIMDVAERLEGTYFRDYWGIDLYDYEESEVEF